MRAISMSYETCFHILPQTSYSEVLPQEAISSTQAGQLTSFFKDPTKPVGSHPVGATSDEVAVEPAPTLRFQGAGILQCCDLKIFVSKNGQMKR